MKNIKIRICNFILLSLILFCISCFNKLPQKSKEGVFKLSFIDKPNVNSIEYGKLEYHSELDTIKLKENDFRSVRFYVGTFKHQNSIETLKKKKLDTFIMLDEKRRIIPFDITFVKEGNQVIDGYIEDKVFLENYYGDGKTRIITHEIKVVRKVDVISSLSAR